MTLFPPEPDLLNLNDISLKKNKAVQIEMFIKF